MPESHYDRMRNSTLASLSARRYAVGGLTDDDDTLTLDPTAIQHELERGPAIHIDPDAAKRFSYTPVGPPALSPNADPSQYVPPALSTRLLGRTAPPAMQFDSGRPAPPVDTSQTSSVFDQLGEGPSPTWKPLTPVGGAVYGLGMAAMGDPEAAEAAMTPRGLAANVGMGALQALTPPRKDKLQEGIIISGRPEVGGGGDVVSRPDDATISNSAQLGSGLYSTAEQAEARARQIQQLIQNVSPPPAAEAEGAPVRDVKARSLEDLERRIPDKERTASPDPTRLINGQPFSSLDMNAPSEGYLPMLHLGPEAANNLNQRLWADSIRESEMPGGSAAIDATRRTGARPPTAEFWDQAMSLPQRARYWYELSGESFTGNHIDLPREMQPGFIDNVAATSGGAEPYTNLKRAIGTYAENLQGVPIYTDLRDPASVRNALNPNLQRLQSLKYNNFSNTMQYTSGLSDRPPLSTNDVQVASMFGVNGQDIGKNPVLYEVMSRYFNKVRDSQNALLPSGAQPWETWQIQAPGWVQERALKNPVKASQYDDYAQVFPRIIQELGDAGVPTPGGKVTMDTLMDPRTPNVMSGTREQFMGTPTATVEVATNRTPQGAAAAQLRAQLEQYDANIPWVRDAKANYTQIQRNTMRDLAMRQGGQPSLVSQLMSEITGRKLDVSRLDWGGYGTFENDINPNLRIPMTGRASSGDFVNLTKPQREAFLSVLGQDLNQEAMAASHFQSVPKGQGQTFSVFMKRFDGHVDEPAIQQFSRQIGYPVNVSQTPNGVLVDVNIGGFDTRPTYEQIENASNATFGNDPNVQDLAISSRAYDSDYVHRNDYRKNINAQSKTRKSRGVGAAGTPPGDNSNLQRLRQALQGVSKARDAEFANWTQNAQARAAKINPGP